MCMQPEWAANVLPWQLAAVSLSASSCPHPPPPTSTLLPQVPLGVRRQRIRLAELHVGDADPDGGPHAARQHP